MDTVYITIYKMWDIWTILYQYFLGFGIFELSQIGDCVTVSGLVKNQAKLVQYVRLNEKFRKSSH